MSQTQRMQPHLTPCLYDLLQNVETTLAQHPWCTYAPASARLWHSSVLHLSPPSHYRQLGVEHVYLTENSEAPTPHVRAEVDDFVEAGFLTYKTEPQPRSQIKVYYNCMAALHAQYNWIAFFDLDEFLILLPGCVSSLAGLPRNGIAATSSTPDSKPHRQCRAPQRTSAEHGCRHARLPYRLPGATPFTSARTACASAHAPLTLLSVPAPQKRP